MRVLLFLLLSLFMLSAFSADNLLRWHDAQHYTVQASTPLKAKRAWKLCALYPSLKDSYWLSLNYGMQEAARRYGVDLKVLEAGGYSQLATQQAQIDQCKQWGAEAILLGSSTTSFPDLQKQVANLPVIELVNALDDPLVKSRVGVPWFQMGYQPGRYLVQWAHGKPLNVLLMPGPDNAGGSKEMVEGFRAAIAGSPVRIVDIALGDNERWSRVFAQPLPEARCVLLILRLVITILKSSVTCCRRCWNAIQKSTSLPERPLRQRRQWGKGVT